MSKNLIPEIAKLLGVEIGEEFKIDYITCDSDTRHRFTETDLELYRIDSWETENDTTLYRLLKGDFEIIKLPWKPKCRDYYFTIGGNDFHIARIPWGDYCTDYMSLKCGMVFRTEAEALKERSRIYKELTGKDWSE